MKPLRDSKGRFLPKKVLLLQEYNHSVQKVGIFSLKDAKKYMQDWGGFYIIQPL